MDIVIQAPLLVKASADVCYDSPIDGRPVTSWDQRQEDLKRHGCRPYDPDQKQDVARRQQESEAQLDKSVDEHVEAAWSKMDGRTRGKLASELVEQGMNAEVIRRTPYV